VLIAGVIKTPDWANEVFSPDFDSTVNVTVPAGHVIMVSFPMLHVTSIYDQLPCSDYSIAFYIGSDPKPRKEFQLCSNYRYEFPK
jgi:hypothetical protein